MKKILTAVVLMVVFCGAARAQFYDWGQDPATVKWRTIRTRDIKYVFPAGYEKNAVRAMHYLDTVRPQIGYGFTHGPMKRMPLIFHAQNFNSNGIVMLAPKRMEFIVTPSADQFAFPALKQLAVHEYRHTVQYNNQNRGLIKVLSWILGQQGSLIGAGFMPLWAMEGDAVLAETQMSTHGRGVQPSFSIEYRAMATEGSRDKFPIDKYFSGSYRDFMPNHYQLGYQILSWSDDHYRANVLDKTAWFSSRNPYLIFPFSIALKKFYGTTEGRIFSDSFDAMFDFWRSLPVEDDTAQIVETPTTSYTTYTSPRAYTVTSESGWREVIIALKSDLDRTSRLVLVDGGTGDERALCNTGSVNSPLTVAGDRIYWTEYRQSTFWEQRVHSQLCSFDMAEGKKHTHPEYRNILFPVAMEGGEIAHVLYNADGRYDIVCGSREWALPDTVTVHGLAHDGGRFYFIGLSDAGMWIGSVGGGETGFRQETRPAYTTLSNLTSGSGRLYFTSIASGKDEAHMYDLAEGKEYRITTSRYGSFSPSPSGSGVVLTTYTRGGYMLARQEIDPGRLAEVPWSRVPDNKVNPERRRWPVMNMDEVTVADTTSRPVRKYRKGLNLFNFHSWAPAYYEPDEIMSEANFDIDLGVTLMSQNNLNSTYTMLGYGWTGSHSLVHGKFFYYGWAPKIELDARWSNSSQLVGGREEGSPSPGKLGNYFEGTARVYLPFSLSSGASFRTLMPSVEWEYNNMKIYKPATKDYETGLHKATFGLQYVENRRMAHRDFLPRFGYAARVNYTLSPVSDDFGRLWSFFGRIYLPGLAAHHSITLRGAYQTQKTTRYAFRQKEVFPRGADFDRITPQQYAAVSGDYQLPVWYPDGGINSFLYFRRVRLNLGGDFARYKTFGSKTVPAAWHDVWSYGGDLIFDIVPLRLPSNTSTTFTISVRKPSDRDEVKVGVSMSLPL